MAAKRKGNRLPPFVPLTWELLNSKAFKELCFAAGKCLPYFLGKSKIKFHDPGKYTEQFTFSYPEAAKLGFARSTFAKCIRDLQAKGFIEWVEHGGLRGKGRGYNRFTLSKRWERYGQQADGIGYCQSMKPEGN